MSNTKRTKPVTDGMLLCSVNGDVQMVGCRGSIRSDAELLGLTGHAINRPDGSVEVRAFGPLDDLNLLLTELHASPTANRNLVQTFHLGPRPATIAVPDKFASKGGHI